MRRCTKILLFLFTLALPCFAQDTLKVGYYEHMPLAFTDSSGVPTGFFVDVLEKIAVTEKWQLTYTLGSYDEIAQKVNSGELDIMLGASTKYVSTATLNFAREPIIADWAQLYAAKGIDVLSVTDIAGLTVAVMKGDPAYTEFFDYLDCWNIPVQFVELEDVAAIFEYVHAGNADLGFASHLSGMFYDSAYVFERTAIYFSPINYTFASGKSISRTFIGTIDKHLQQMRADGRSYYYKRFDYWIGGRAAQEGGALSKIFADKRYVAIFCGLFVVFLFFIALVIWRAYSRARDAEKEYDRMQTLHEETKKFNMDEIQRLEVGFADFRASFARILAKLDQIVFATDAERRVTMLGGGTEKLFDIKFSEELLGKHLFDILPMNRISNETLKTAVDKYSSAKLSRQKNFSFELQISVRNEKKTLLFNEISLFDANGFFIGTNGIVTDVSLEKAQLKALERELAFNECINEMSKMLANSRGSIENIEKVLISGLKRCTECRNVKIVVRNFIDSNMESAFFAITNAFSKKHANMLDAVLTSSVSDNAGGWCDEAHLENSGKIAEDEAVRGAAALINEGIIIENSHSIPLILGNENIGQILLANAAEGFSQRELERATVLANFYTQALLTAKTEMVFEHLLYKTFDLFDGYNQPVYIKATTGNFMLVNRAFERCLHINRREIIGRTESEAFALSIAQKLSDGDAEVLTGEDVIDTKTIDFPSGELNLQIVKKPIIFDDKCVAIFGTLFDNTAVEIARASEEELERKYHFEQSERERIERELKNSQTHVSELADKYRAEIADLRQQIATLEVTLPTTPAVDENELAMLRGKLAETESTLANERAHFADELANLNTRIEEVSNVEIDRAKLETKVVYLENENMRLQTTLNEAENRPEMPPTATVTEDIVAEQLTQLREKLSAEHEDYIARLRETHTYQLQATRLEVSELADKYRAEIADLRQQIATLEVTLPTTPAVDENELAMLRGKLAETESTLANERAHFADELANLNTRIEEVSNVEIDRAKPFEPEVAQPIAQDEPFVAQKTTPDVDDMSIQTAPDVPLFDDDYAIRLTAENRPAYVIRDSYIVFANAKTAEEFGFLEDELTTAPFSTFVAFEDQFTVEKIYSDVQDGIDLPATMRFKIMDWNGYEREFEVALERVRFAEGFGVVSFAEYVAPQVHEREDIWLDSTDDKPIDAIINTTSENLRVFDELFAAELVSSPRATLIIQDGMVKFANDAALECLVSSAAQLLQKHVTEFVMPSDVEKTLTYYMDIQSGKPREGFLRLTVITGNGGWRVIEAITEPIKLNNRRATLNFLRAIT